MVNGPLDKVMLFKWRLAWFSATHMEKLELNPSPVSAIQSNDNEELSLKLIANNTTIAHRLIGARMKRLYVSGENK
jgi:hypothetical protein